MESRSELEAMAELAKQLFERYIGPRITVELLNHSLNGYKATVETNNGDGTLTVRRPFDSVSMTLRCPPALAAEAHPGKQVLVIQLGDASNAFILCGTDMSGFGDGGGGGDGSLNELGDIAQITVNRLNTSNRIRKYFLQDATDDNFLRIDGNQIQYVVGSVISQTPVQAQDRYGNNLYWEAQPAGHLPDGSPVDVAGDRIYSTIVVTDWPVYTYTYSDTVQATYVRSTRTVNGKPLSSDVTLNASDVGAQSEILVSGILKGDGQGSVSAATPGTDYGTYSKPSGGIPASDMTSAVQTSLGKADTAYQKPSGGIPASDLASGVIPAVPSPSDAAPQDLASTASAGSSGNYSRADHAHKMPSAADVGALASGGTAAAASRLNWSHKTSTPQGWHKVLTIPFAGDGLRRKFAIIVEASGSGAVGILRCNWLRASASNYTIAASWLSVGTAGWADAATARDGTNISLYIKKTAIDGQMVITVLESTNQNGNDIYMPQYFADTTSDADYVSELPAGAVIAAGPMAELDGAGNNIADGKLWYSSVTVSSGTNQVVSTISDSRITADYALARIEFADPSLIMAGYSWDTGAGNFTLTGSVFAATTANVLLIRKGN